MKSDYSIRRLCQVLEVSQSGYYGWVHRARHPAGRTLENLQLLQAIARIHQASRQTYGSPRIQSCLAKQGRRHGRNRIARLMRQGRISGRARRRFKPHTTDSNHPHPIAPNRLAQSPPPQAPNQVWVSDITYVETGEGWLFLSAIMDLFSRRIVGWSMEKSLDTRLVLGSWHMARTHRRPPPHLLFHSDRGSQYASRCMGSALQEAGAMASMSRRGNCYDNAAMESFWSTLKIELIYRGRFETRAQAQTAIFDYIEAFYNRSRLHSSLSYLSPVDFESHYN